MGPETGHGVVLACLGENRDDWFRKIQNLVLSLRLFGGSLADAPFVAHFVGGAEPAYVEALEQLGARVRVVEPMDPRLPTSNKLRMLELAASEDFAVLVMLDCDLLVRGDLAEELRSTELRAAPAGKRQLTDEQWETLYRDHGIPLPSVRWTMASGERGYPYWNTGVLVVPRGACEPLGRQWLELMTAVLDGASGGDDVGGRPSRLFAKDQIPFALALARAGLVVDPLPMRLNYPATRLGLAAEHRNPFRPPFVFHYHRSIDDAGFVGPSPDPEVDRYLDEFNRARGEALGLRYDGMPALDASARARTALNAHGWYRSAKRRYLAVRRRRL